MPSPSENVLLVKLPRQLAEELRQHAEAWQVAYSQGKNAPGNPDGKLLSLQAIVRVLLDRDKAHRRRSNRPKQVKYLG